MRLATPSLAAVASVLPLFPNGAAVREGKEEGRKEERKERMARKMERREIG